MSIPKGLMPQPPRNPDRWYAFPHTPLLYRNPVPVTPKTHENMSLRPIGPAMARETAFIPITLPEFDQISHSLPIMFDEGGQPYAAVGLRERDNLFVNEEGSWTAGAPLPGYVRRYPFIHYVHPETGKFVLCVDMNPQVIVESDENPLFDADQNPTAVLKAAVEVCKAYGEEESRTAEFSAALAASRLLEPREIIADEDSPDDGSYMAWILDGPDLLNDLADDIFLEWRRRGWLAPIYAYLSSRPHWDRLTALFAEKTGQ